MSTHLAHMVFFKLKDNSTAAANKLVAECSKYLKPHAGIVYYSAGILARELNRDVNDQNFDVALHVVFTDLKHHDAYQESDPHNEFIARNKDNWEKVRVFDSHV
ncbi:MAG: Dabb family protein [Planctomycetes bacterium]|nr:Dabb family protein [Planctomycetota bacterium]NBY03192.1 Dabb family protein [Planctomycetota bacterium]